MTTGKIKWYNEDKGFGFIEVENRDDVFVHRSGLENPYDGLQEEDEVSFDTKQGPKGLMAINVKAIN